MTFCAALLLAEQQRTDMGEGGSGRVGRSGGSRAYREIGAWGQISSYIWLYLLLKLDSKRIVPVLQSSKNDAYANGPKESHSAEFK